ncbi:unnamed protein product [Withania somnifera]
MIVFTSSMFCSVPTWPLGNPLKIKQYSGKSILRRLTLTRRQAKRWKAQNERNEDLADTLIILQHQPVYTLGTVMYPIINLRYHKMDLHWYLRSLEEVIIRVLSSSFSMEASRIDGLTGVWVGKGAELAAIGIRVSQWVTYHGLALNVTTDLSPFQQIVPCGIRDRQVGSIKGLLREHSHSNGCGTENYQLTDDVQLIDITHKSLVKEFCEAFQADLQCKPTPLLVS